MAEVEFPKPPRPSSSNWSLGSNQFASGRFPKVSISVPFERSQTGADSKAVHQSQTGLRLSRVERPQNGQTGLRLSQEKLLEETVKRLSQELSPPRPNPWISPRPPNPNQNQNLILNSNSDPKSKESLLGKRKEPVQEAGTSGTNNNTNNNNNNNTEGLRMKLWEILNTGSQNPEATQSPQIGVETVKKPIQNQNQNNHNQSSVKSSESKQEKAKLGKENDNNNNNNIFSDPIETDSEGSKRVEVRPVTRSLSLKKNSTVLNGGSKRAKVEPRKLNFPKMPLVTDKNTTKPSPVTKEKTPIESAKTCVMNKRQNVGRKTVSASNKMNNKSKEREKENEKENSWDFPVTPAGNNNNNNNNEQEKESLSPKFGRNRRGVLTELKGSLVNTSNSGITLRRRKPLETEPIQKEASVLKGSSAIKTNNSGASMQRTKTAEKENKPVRSEPMQLDPPNTERKKQVEELESPVTSDDMQIERENSKGSFVNKINTGAFMQRKSNPVEQSPVTSDDLQPERNDNSRGSFANKMNLGASLHKEKRVEFPVSPVTIDDLQPNNNSRGSFANKINAGAFTQRKSNPVELSPVTNDDLQPNNNLKGSFAIKINSGASLQKDKQRVEVPVSPVTSEDFQPEKESRGSFTNKINSGTSLQKDKQRIEVSVSPVTSNATQSPLNMSDYRKSPTFAINGTSSSNPNFKGLNEEISVRERNPKSLTSFETCSESDPDYELSEDTRDSNDAFGMKKKLQNPSPIENLEINSFLNKGYKRTDRLFSDLDSSPIQFKSSPVIIKNKAGGKSVKLHERKKEAVELFTPTPIDTEDEEESNASEDLPTQFPESDLASAVCQLALVLKKFKAKLKTKTNTKSAEILSVTAEKIEQMLKEAQAQMQEDSRKFIGCSNSKRKHLESKFQEQSEKLKAIHEKFREEVNQQLMECKASFEEFEAYQLELKGIAEKQKAVHRKLLSHVEEETKTQLSDAEKKISLVHREANKKMTGLKRVIKQWIPEGAD